MTCGPALLAVARLSHPAVCLLVLLAASPCSAPAQRSHAPAIRLDGRVSPGEWDGASRHALTGGGEIWIEEDAAHLYVALATEAFGWSHLYLPARDTVFVLHASAALGTARYERRDTGRWHLTQPFSWSVRDTSFSAAARAEREAFFEAHGWIASTQRMGSGRVTEYRVSKARFDAPLRLAALRASDPAQPHYWPADLGDATLHADLIRGSAPDDLDFRPEQWAEVAAEAFDTPAQSPETVFTLDNRAFAAEGIAAAPDGSFFLSSVYLGTVVRVQPDGTSAPFAAAPGGWSVLGITTDAARGALWAATAAWPQARDAAVADHGRTALVQFDLSTGAVRSAYPRRGALGDVTVGPDGTVYATDGVEGAVYILDGDSLRALVPPGVLHSPQGLAFGRDPHRLFVVDYRHGLVAIDTRTGVVTLVPHLPGIDDRGADGLAYADGALYAVQNGVRPHRVWRWRLAPDESRVVAADILASAENDDRFSEPTLTTVWGSWVYVVAASGWAHYADDGTLDIAAAAPPAVLRMRR